jgi:hypothetical protein
MKFAHEKARRGGRAFAGCAGDQRPVVELDPVGLTVEPLGDVLGPTVLPDGFIAPLAPLFTAPEVPPADAPDPVVPVEPAPVLAPALPPADPPALPPPLWANASDDVRARAEASAMVANFMSTSFRFVRWQLPAMCFVPVSGAARRGIPAKQPAIHPAKSPCLVAVRPRTP